MNKFENELNKHSNEKKYFLKSKYISKLIKNMYLDMVIILAFFVIFNILYSNASIYSTIRIVLIIIFAIIGVLNTMLCIKSISKKKGFYYQATNNALVHFNGKKEFIYPWSDFKNIFKDENKLDMMYPVVFKTTNTTFMLNKNTDNSKDLISEIVKHTHDIAEIDVKVIEEFK